jgi:hypothetical protein
MTDSESGPLQSNHASLNSHVVKIQKGFYLASVWIANCFLRLISVVSGKSSLSARRGTTDGKARIAASKAL